MTFSKVKFLISTVLILFVSLNGVEAVAAKAKKQRPIVSFTGKVSSLKNGRNIKRKRYWEYKVKTAAGKTITVHDYKFGKYRQPASVGIQEGTKTTVRGFFVKISKSAGSKEKREVLIIPLQ